MLSEEDQSILQLIETGIRHCIGSGVSDPLLLGRITAAYLEGLAGDALVEIPISRFGKRLCEAIELLDSGIIPDSLCNELEARWDS